MANVRMQPSRHDFMVYGLPWLLAGIALAFSRIDSSHATAFAPWMFLLSLLVLGMPHGFIDALILLSPGRGGQSFGARRQLQLLGGYLAVAGAYAWLWSLHGGLAMGLFLALTAWHWGSAEAGSIRGLNWTQLLLALSKGAIVVCSLFAFHHDEAMQVTSTFGFSMPVAWGWAGFASAVGGFGLLLAWAHRHHPAGALRPLIDTGIVVSLLALTPLFLGLTVFYAGFHSYRHFLWFRRSADTHSSPAGTLLGRTALKAHGYSAIMVLVLVCAIGFLFRSHPSSIELATIPLHLQLLAVLTMPHTLFISWLQCRPNHFIAPMNLLTTEPTR